MTAQNLVEKLTEADGQASPDPDDPDMFLRNYKDEFERLGFVKNPEAAQGWIWKQGPCGIKVSTGTPDWLGNGTTDYHVLALIEDPQSTPGAERYSEYANRTVASLRLALKAVKKYQAEMPTSLQAKLVALGFSGWRNRWYKNNVNVKLEPTYVYAELKLSFPKDRAVEVLTKLDSVGKELSNQNG